MGEGSSSFSGYGEAATVVAETALRNRGRAKQFPVP